MDPEPECYVFSALFNGAGPGDGQSDISKLSLVTCSIYTNKHTNSHATCMQTWSCACMLHSHTHTQLLTGRWAHKHKQTNNGVGFLRGGGAGHSHKQLLFKVSGKIPPSSL